MLIEALLALTTMAPLVDTGAQGLAARIAALGAQAVPSAPPAVVPYFSVTARAVSNWREEAGVALMPTSLALVARHAVNEPAFVARCVKLNNYWCIKQARWVGELGGDAENHTAFATAAAGADAAALLVRRYYREFNRRNASAIVRRWAPAECTLPRSAAAAWPATAARVTPQPQPRPQRSRLQAHVSAELAPQGIGKTLRARFLARRAPSGAPRRVAASRQATQDSAATRPRPILPRAGIDANLRVQPWSARARLAGHLARVGSRTAVPTPKPVVNIATRPSTAIVVEASSVVQPTPPKTQPSARASREPPRLVNPSSILAQDQLVAEAAALPSIAAGLPAGSLLDLRVPAPLCSYDENRIRNYAGRIASSVGLTPTDDLKLFDAEGQPTANLLPVLLTMSSVELGALRASPALVTASIERLKLRFNGIAASAQ